MKNRVEKHLEELKVLKKAKPKIRKQILAQCNRDLVRCIGDCCYNVVKGNIKLSQKQKKRLKRHKNPVRLLASKKVSLKKKKDLLVQKGGFLPALLAPILGIAGSLISGLIR